MVESIMDLPVFASKRQTFTEELPKSIPRSNLRILPEDGVKCSNNTDNQNRPNLKTSACFEQFL